MKAFLKKTAAFIVAILIYVVGMMSWNYYQDHSGWSFANILAFLVAVIIVTVPVMDYWETKAKRWFRVDNPTKEASDEQRLD